MIIKDGRFTYSAVFWNVRTAGKISSAPVPSVPVGRSADHSGSGSVPCGLPKPGTQRGSASIPVDIPPRCWTVGKSRNQQPPCIGRPCLWGKIGGYIMVECFFQKLKWLRRIAARYDQLDASFLTFVSFASIAILLICLCFLNFFKQVLISLRYCLCHVCDRMLPFYHNPITLCRHRL